MGGKRYRQCGIYCYHNIVNGKNYVGQSVDLYGRKRKFGNGTGTYSGKVFQNAIKKYGKKNFQYSILTHCKPEELNYYERFYISRLNTTDRRYGYNCTNGGDSKYFRTEDCKERMREAWTEERKKNYSESQKGENNGFFGCKHSEETREALKKFASEHYKQRFLKEHGYSVGELAEKLKKYVKENPYATYADIMSDFGISYRTMIKTCHKIGYSSENAILKKREEEKKVVAQCDREDHAIVLNYFPSISYAKKATGIKSINGCLNGSRTQAGGYFWRMLLAGETPDFTLRKEYLKRTENHRRLDEKQKERIRANGGWRHDSLKKAVFRYGPNGRLVKRYDSVASAKADGFNGCDVSNCCRGKTKTLYGYVFSYKELAPDEVKKMFVNNNIKPVVQLTMGGEYVREWDSATDAAKNLCLSTMSNINSCCHGRVGSAAGYKWMFKKDYYSNETQPSKD